MEFLFDALPAKERYKLIVSTVVPRPIAWVVTQSDAGVVNAAPYSFFNAVSEEPPLLMVSIGGRSGQFVVNLVSEAMAQAMVVTAIDFDPAVSEVAEAKLATLPSTLIAPPRIADSPVAFECELFQTISLPDDRSLVLGRIVAMHVADEAVRDAARHYIDTPKLGLVGRMHGGGWYARTEDQFEIPRIAVKDWQRAAE
jgi:flavin reductase (DIM6/NTAB) family NADH-FMN oxidoreductase RutF